MANSKSNRGKKLLTLILMIVSLNTIYVLPYLSYSYYTPLMEAMNLVGREADYGRLLNFYGIANVILYLPGGWVADKFDAKKLLVFSMISTGVLGLWEATFPSYEMLFVIYVMFAVTTVLTYWSSSIKCIISSLSSAIATFNFDISPSHEPPQVRRPYLPFLTDLQFSL